MYSTIFDLNVGPLLGTYPGDRTNFVFDGIVPATEWEDITVIGSLKFGVELIAIEEGIDTIMRDLIGKVEYEGREYEIRISQVERSFTRTPKLDDPDDINPVDLKRAVVHFGKVLREEILMQIL